jgi:hypothetical protein
MYTIVERRTINRERLPETLRRAEHEFFPKLRAAPGFIGFYLVADEPQEINTAVLVWASKARADVFDTENSGWLQTLEALGHTLQSDNRGETVIQIEPAH